MTQRILCLLALCLCSCSMVPTPNGRAVFVGGKRAFRASTTETVLVENSEKSFRDGVIAVGVVAGAYYSAASAAAQELTARHAATQATTQHAAAQATIQHAASEATKVSTFVPP